MSLPRITALARLLRERELARLAEATARARTLHQQLGALDAQVQRRSAQLAGLVRRTGEPEHGGSESGEPESGEPESGEPWPVKAGSAGTGSSEDARSDPTLVAGAEALWLRRLSRERESLQGSLYAQMAEIEDLRARAARAFGRSEVLAKLTETERCAVQHARAKRDHPG